MKKIEEKPMSKWTAGGLLGATFFLFLSVGCGYVGGTSATEKHLGPVTVRNVDNQQGSLEFIRSDGEFFEVKFTPGWNNPNLHVGDSLKDVVYYDANRGESMFGKAVLDKEAPTADEVLYSSEYHSAGIFCSGSECHQYAEMGKKFYHWSDGGYREKPETKKAAHETN